MQSPTSFEACLTNPDSSFAIISNQINTNITAPSLSPIKASVSSSSVGEAISSTEFAFGSQVTLTTNFAHPVIDVASGQQAVDTVKYT